MNASTPHLVVIGGGAAGFFCAVNAARLAPHIRVTIVEKGSKVLQKVKVSGGGRCNVTHFSDSISEMAKCYPRGEKFVKRSFHRFFVKNTIAWFAERGVALKSEPDERMFPVTNESQTIIDCLLREANLYQVELLMNFSVTGLQKVDDKWVISGQGNRQLVADYCMVATGGFPKADMFAWLVSGTGHQLVAPHPSLFTFNIPKHPITQLMGVATPALVKIAGMKWESKGPLLITHWGLSGPAVLRLSAFAARDLAEKNYQFTAIVNWMPAYNETSLREAIIQYRQQKGSQKVENADWVNLPQRLWLFLLQEAGIDKETRWAVLPAGQQNLLIKKLCGYELVASGKTTFKDEFVTAGGIDTAEIWPDTMESRLCPGLYFGGEVMNVDGITGGYNFQHAWTSGFAAATAIAAKCGDFQQGQV